MKFKDIFKRNINLKREKSSQCKERKPLIRPIRLKNLGKNCYLNSALQAVSSGDKFFTDVRSLVSQYPPELKNLNVFHNLIHILNGGQSKALIISKNKIFENWNKSNHQDSFELLAFVFNEVYNEIRKYKENQGEIPKYNITQWLMIRLPMRIVFSNDIYCKCGLVYSSPLQCDLALHIPVPISETCSLQSLVDKFFLIEPIENYLCDNVKCIGEAYKKTRLLAPIPNTICIHLQKSHWTGAKLEKIKNKIQFEKTLKIRKEFCFEYQKPDSNQLQTEQATVDTVRINSEGNVDVKYECSNQSISGSQEISNIANCKVENDIFIDGKSSIEKHEKINSLSNINQKSIELSEENVASGDDLADQNNEIIGKVNDLSIENQKSINVAVVFGNGFVETANLDFCNSENEKENGESQNMRIQNNIEKSNFHIEEHIARDEILTLKSVIVHSGSVYKGHYVCYKVVGGNWYLTNDFVVKKVKESEVFSCDAYILFYEKI